MTTILLQHCKTKTGSLIYREKNQLFLRKLEEYQSLVSPLDIALQNSIKDIIFHLKKQQITLTFGGHFKSGKSTVINGMLGRNLLPTDDYPETGAICCLAAGSKDSVEVCVGNNKRRIPCDTTAIRQEISLISETGERRPEVCDIRQLDITLQTRAISQGAIWIDSPGINDTPEMNDCAWRAAAKTDVLLWVLSSRQCLSETEMAFLANYVEEHGPDAVVFVLNIFLGQDTQQEWNKSLEQKVPVHLAKIQYSATSLGFTDGWQPLVIPIAGRAVAKFPDQFGGEDLRNLLISLDGEKHPRIQYARWFYVARHLQKVAQKTQSIWEQEQESFAKEQQAFEQKRQQMEQRKQDFISGVKRTVDDCLSDWHQRAYNCGTSLSNSIDSLQRDDTYSQKLTRSLRGAAQKVAEILLEKVSSLQVQFKQSSLDASEQYKLRQKLTPLEAHVEVANNPVEEGEGAAGAVGGAIVGAGIGSAIFPGLGTLIGAAIGAVAGGSSSYDDAVAAAIRKDIDDTKSNVRKAAQSAVNSLQGKRQEIIDFIVNCCTTDSNLSGVSKPDDTSVKFWEAMYTKVLCLVQEAEEMTKELTAQN